MSPTMTVRINDRASGVWRAAHGLEAERLDVAPNGRAALVRMPPGDFKGGRRSRQAGDLLHPDYRGFEVAMSTELVSYGVSYAVLTPICRGKAEFSYGDRYGQGSELRTDPSPTGRGVLRT